MSISFSQIETEFSRATAAIHVDDFDAGPDVPPPMHPSTTFRYSSNPDELEPLPELTKGELTYARRARPTMTRLEHVLTKVLGGETLTYSTGLSPIHSYLLRLRPKRVAISGGYHGAHAVIAIHERENGIEKVTLEDVEDLQPGDVIHLETPVNPTGISRNIAEYATIARRKGLWLVVDSTFGPPALQDPFYFGADLVIHSGTKFIGGHSDIMCGILAISPKKEDLFQKLWEDRSAIGNIPGSHETWLALRSLRTLELRTLQQAKNGTALVSWLKERMDDPFPNEVNRMVKDLSHTSLQHADMSWIKHQMPNGFTPVFGMTMRSEKLARNLPSKLRIFQHATSLGGVESLIEWRKMSDGMADGQFMRLSIGIEAIDDLIKDLSNGLKALDEEGL